MHQDVARHANRQKHTQGEMHKKQDVSRLPNQSASVSLSFIAKMR